MQQLIRLIAGDPGKSLVCVTKFCLRALMILQDKDAQLSAIGRILNGLLPDCAFLHLPFQFFGFGNILKLAHFADGTVLQLDGHASYLKDSSCFRQAIFLKTATVFLLDLIHH